MTAGRNEQQDVAIEAQNKIFAIVKNINENAGKAA